MKYLAKSLPRLTLRLFASKRLTKDDLAPVYLETQLKPCYAPHSNHTFLKKPLQGPSLRSLTVSILLLSNSLYSTI